MSNQDNPQKIDRETCLFYKSWWKAIECLPRDVRLDVYEAITRYCFGATPTEEQLKPTARALLTLIRPQIDANFEKYLNGLKGGRGNKKSVDVEQVEDSAESKQKPKQNQTETKTKPNVNQTETKVEPIMINDICNILKKSTDVDTKSPPASSTSESYVFRDLSEIMIELRAETGWIDQYAAKYDCTANEILSYLDEYVKQQIEDNKTLRSKDDVRRHIRYWLPKFINSTKNERSSPPDRYDKRRGTPATGVKPKNYTTTF